MTEARQKGVRKVNENENKNTWNKMWTTTGTYNELKSSVWGTYQLKTAENEERMMNVEERLKIFA